MSELAETYATGFQNLQQQFNGAIEVVPTSESSSALDPKDVMNALSIETFHDISAPVRDLDPFLGRVVLWPGRKTGEYFPAVITKKVSGNGDTSVQMSVLKSQPFDPEVGITSGILFSLGLKTETNDTSFGAHTSAKGLESGHLAPTFIAVASSEAANQILTYGDKGTHAIGQDAGGVPEKVIETGLLPGISPIKTVELPIDNPHPIGLMWHPKLEDKDTGLMVASYTGGPGSAIELMLGGASIAIGPKLVEEVGMFTDAAVRGI